ncbi:hydrolase TatD [bacterium]|nr:hydrolase TatD [bacterium]|tara:strand:+ start:24534 stop:25367 length:834 start_codon:yes stop_codon:yes gene_type:complete
MEPKAIDIHSHVNFEAFAEDRDDVIKRAFEAGVWMINVGTEASTSKSAVEFAHKYDTGMYATVGLHPIHAGGSDYHDKNELTENEFNSLKTDVGFVKELGRDDKVLAVGECGLDYYRLETDTKEKQKKAFIEQIHLANELGKPLMLHARGERGDDTPYEEALEILQKESKVKGNFHFFAGSLDVAQKIWSAGYTTSFTGVITFARVYEKLIKEAPLDKIMVETDCPYAAPVPHRGKRNEPLFVLDIVEKVAKIKKMPVEDVQKQLVTNTMNFFGLSA